jgi:hypothetical protein
VQYLRTRGFKARTSWIRALHTFALPTSRLLIRLGFYRTVSNQSGTSYPVIDLKRIPPVRKLWAYFEIFSMLPLVMTRVALPSFLGWVVVSERFTLDSIASISWLTEDETFFNSRPARILMGLIKQDYCLINLDCDYDTIVSRRGKISEPQKFIDTQEKIYSELSPKLQYWELNTSKFGINETQLRIRKHVMHYLMSSNGKKADSISADAEPAEELREHIRYV